MNQIFRGVALAPSAGLAPQFYGAAKSTNSFALTWTTLINRNYTLQAIDNLLNTNWTTVTNFTATAPLASVTNAIAPDSTNRFFRVILNP